jgi:hypothetical protein
VYLTKREKDRRTDRGSGSGRDRGRVEVDRWGEEEKIEQGIQ